VQSGGVIAQPVQAVGAAHPVYQTGLLRIGLEAAGKKAFEADAAQGIEILHKDGCRGIGSRYGDVIGRARRRQLYGFSPTGPRRPGAPRGPILDLIRDTPDRLVRLFRLAVGGAERPRKQTGTVPPRCDTEAIKSARLVPIG